MAFGLVLPLRIVQLVFAIIVAGTAGYVFHWYDVDTLINPPTQINFLIAVPIFSIVSVLYLEITSRFIPRIYHQYVHLTFEVLNTVLYFAGFIALSAFLNKLLFCRGKVCAAARASAVFGALSFLLWTITTAILLLDMFRGGVAGVQTDRKAEKAMKESKSEAQQAAPAPTV